MTDKAEVKTSTIKEIRALWRMIDHLLWCRPITSACWRTALKDRGWMLHEQSPAWIGETPKPGPEHDAFLADAWRNVPPIHVRRNDDGRWERVE